MIMLAIGLLCGLGIGVVLGLMYAKSVKKALSDKIDA